MEKNNFSNFLSKSGKMFALQERGVAMNLRLNNEGAALHIDLEAGVTNRKSSCYSMPVRTRGGLYKNNGWRSERVFTTVTGVKIQRINGRYQYNPPTLKFTCVRVLDRHFPDPRNPRLYATVQGCVDQLVDMVEDHLKGLEWEGTLSYLEMNLRIWHIPSPKISD